MGLALSTASADLDLPEAPADPAVGDRTVLVLAPSGNDAILTQKILGAARIKVQVCAGWWDLNQAMLGGCAVILLAEETLKSDSVPVLISALARQPAWSEIPVVIITSGGEVDQARLRRLAIFGPATNVTLLERPFRPGTLVSTVEAALRSRMRQYQVRDLLSEVSSARDASEQANRAKDAFLAALSHELRTPLNPALLLATELAGDESIPADLRSNFNSIAANIMLEARLIDDLLDLTRISQGKLALDKRPSALHGILRDALAKIAGELEEKRLILSVHLCAADPVVDCDPVRLQQVFWNVLKNAAKFTDKDGRIAVTTRIDSESGPLVIEIADSGIGMTPEELSRLFVAFSQGDHAGGRGSHRFGGLGLGLAISRTLLEMHSGSIRASSPGPQRGSTFTIELPLRRR